jgi:hypothetical protein
MSDEVSFDARVRERFIRAVSFHITGFELHRWARTMRELFPRDGDPLPSPLTRLIISAATSFAQNQHSMLRPLPSSLVEHLAAAGRAAWN